MISLALFVTAGVLGSGIFLTGGVVFAAFPLIMFIRVLVGDITRHGGSSGHDDLPNLPGT